MNSLNAMKPDHKIEAEIAKLQVIVDDVMGMEMFTASEQEHAIMQNAMGAQDALRWALGRDERPAHKGLPVDPVSKCAAGNLQYWRDLLAKVKR